MNQATKSVSTVIATIMLALSISSAVLAPTSACADASPIAMHFCALSNLAGHFLFDDHSPELPGIDSFHE